MKKSRSNQVGNFGKAVSFVNAQGPLYNPSKASIQVAALDALLTEAQGSLKAADVSRTAYEQHINARHVVFRAIPRLSRRIISALKASGVSRDALDDVMAIKRRFSSQKGKPVAITPDAATSPDGISPGVKLQRRLSHLDLDSQIANFRRLVIRVTSMAEYNPNEAELRADELNTFVATLKGTNDAVIRAFIAMKEANQSVDRILYGPDGVYEKTTAMKAYIESVFGYRSEKHREISTLKFRKK